MTKISAPQYNEYAYIECPIMGDETEDIVLTPCKHAFDSSHLLEWLNRSVSEVATCPVCREEFTLETLEFEGDDSCKDVVPFRETAKRIWIWLRKSSGCVKGYCVDFIDEISERSSTTLSPLYFNLIPTVLGSCRLITSGSTMDPLRRLNFLTTEVVSGMVVIPAYILSEKACQFARSGSFMSVGVRRILMGGRGAMLLGNTLLTISHYDESQSLQKLSSVLVSGGVLMSSTVSFAYTIKKQWDTRVSSGDFARKLTPNLLCIGFIFMMVYYFALMIFSAQCRIKE